MRSNICDVGIERRWLNKHPLLGTSKTSPRSLKLKARLRDRAGRIAEAVATEGLRTVARDAVIEIVKNVIS
jgi:hypothetical protein